MTRVLVAGTFDLLHPGHRFFFAEAAKLGEVTALIARDASVQRIKGRLPVDSERRRVQRVARVPEVAHAMLGDKKDFLRPVLRVRPDIIALGFDQKTFDESELVARLAARGLAVRTVRLPSHLPDIYKTSKLRA